MKKKEEPTQRQLSIALDERRHSANFGVAVVSCWSILFPEFACLSGIAMKDPGPCLAWVVQKSGFAGGESALGDTKDHTRHASMLHQTARKGCFRSECGLMRSKKAYRKSDPSQTS